MFDLSIKNKVLFFTTGTLNSFAMQNDSKNISKSANLIQNNYNQNIDKNNTFINSKLVTDAYYNGKDIKHNNKHYMALNKYICINYELTKKIVTKSTGDGNCLFNLLSSLIFNTEKYHHILRLFLCNK